MVADDVGKVIVVPSVPAIVKELDIAKVLPVARFKVFVPFGVIVNPFTDVGVIAANPIVKAGVGEVIDQVAVTPLFAAAVDTEVTVPVPTEAQVGAAVPPLLFNTCPEVPFVSIAVVPAADWYGIDPPRPPARLVDVPEVNPAAVPVIFVPTNAEGVPSAGVTKVGEDAKTAAPVPVSSVNAPNKLAEVNEPSEAVLPKEVTMPIKFAFVVTVEAFPPILKFATGVVDVTTNGAVPVAIVELSCVPDNVPVAATETGVIAPATIVKAGVVPPVEVPLKPLAVAIETEATPPPLGATHDGANVVPLLCKTWPDVPLARRVGAPEAPP